MAAKTKKTTKENAKEFTFEFKDVNTVNARADIEAYLDALEEAYSKAVSANNLEICTRIETDAPVLVQRLNAYLKSEFYTTVSKQSDPMVYAINAIRFVGRKAVFKVDDETNVRTFRVESKYIPVDLQYANTHCNRNGVKFGNKSSWLPLMQGVYCAIIKSSARELNANVTDDEIVSKYKISSDGKVEFLKLFKEEGKITEKECFALTVSEDFIGEKLTSKRSIKTACQAVSDAMVGKNKALIKTSDVSALIKTFHGERTKYARKGETNKIPVPSLASFVTSFMMMMNNAINEKAYELDMPREKK